MINIKMMTEEAYATLQKNYKDVYEQIKNHPSDSTWLEGYLGFNPYETKKYLIEDFELKDSEEYSEVAFENGIVLYEHLKDLPRYIVCNCRFWAWVTFDKAYKQAQHAMKLSTATTLKNGWLGTNARRSLMLFAISQSYFRIETSVDETKENKYELSKYLFDDAEVYRGIAYRNIGMLQNVNTALIQAVVDAKEKFGFEPDREAVRLLMKDASRIGSVMLIDNMSKDEIYEILYKKLGKRLTDSFLNEEV